MIKKKEITEKTMLYGLIKRLVRLAVSMVFALVLLSLFLLAYSFTGVHITNKMGATDYRWEANQLKSNMYEGFSWMRMNDEGFNNSFNYSDVDGIDILIMGSSHMEGVNIPKEKNVGYLLNNEYLSEFVTYNIGISGHTIDRCVNNLEDAINYYNPRKYVIIETSDVNLDLNQMQKVVEGSLSRIHSYDSGIVYVIQKYIPSVLSIYREIDNWMSASKSILRKQILTFSETVGAKAENEDDYLAVLGRMMDIIEKSADGIKVIIVYHPDTVLDNNGYLISPQDSSIDLFKKTCGEHGIYFVNMFDDFCREYDDNHELPHGFTNTAIGVGHLNTLGHRLIADKLGNVIREIEDGSE